uniref:DUF983 domain-containing protein n=1 Tax=Thermogemmatispora argillosa TaxID=2045280 RepID=A0A455T4X7_9CHLR|nr:hypothetical protein KTA_31450 [Thermogemmatispora argillosa]
MTWKRARVLFIRALLLRCPVCGEGKLYSGFFKTYERCPACNFEYEREPGYYTGAMAVNLVLSELLITAITIPLAVNTSVPFIPLLIWGMTMPIIFPLIFYRHTKSFWMAFDHLIHPVTNERIFFPE